MKNIFYYVIQKDKNGGARASLYYPALLDNSNGKDTLQENFDFLLKFGKLRGKTYLEKKAAAEDLAIEYSLHCAPGLSYCELITIYNYFEKIAKKYGLVNDFKANCII